MTNLEALIEKMEIIIGSSIGSVSAISAMEGRTTDGVIAIRNKAMDDMENLILKAHATGKQEGYKNVGIIIENSLPNLLHEFNREMNYSEKAPLPPLERIAIKRKYTNELLSKLEEMRKE